MNNIESKDNTFIDPEHLDEWLEGLIDDPVFVGMMEKADDMYGEDGWTISITVVPETNRASFTFEPAGDEEE